MLQAPPEGFDFPLVTKLTAFIALPVKILVDIIKAWTGLQNGPTPAVGVVVAYAFCLVVLVASRTTFDRSIYAQCFIAALGAQGLAMAATWNQNRAQRVNERIQAAIDSTKGSTTVADINKQVLGGDGNK